ncbi:hypothetical protein Tco_1269407, partial [Tanacetum coccineum]
VVTKIKSLKNPLRKLLRDHGNLHDHVVKLRHELDEVQKAMNLNPTDSNLRDEKAVYVKAFTEAKMDEERFLKPKSKFEWLDVGDSNSAYFHKSVKSRIQRSRSHMECDNINLEGLFTKIILTSTCNNMVRKILDIEIKDAMFDIGDDKTSGPDGCGKIITNRIIEGIKEVVSENQSAFVPGRWITDNILIAQELMHYYHRNRGPPRCAFKVDIQKAYDAVD